MIISGNVDREYFIRAVETDNFKELDRLFNTTELTCISQWVNMQLYVAPSSEMIDYLLEKCPVSDYTLSETLVQAARKNNLAMVKNLIARGAKDDIQFQAMAFAIIHHNKETARLIAPVSSPTFLSEAIGTMDFVSRDFLQAVLDENFREKLTTALSETQHSNIRTKKM